MKKNKLERLIAFYGALVGVIRSREFVTASAETLVEIYSEMVAELSVPIVTVDDLREIHSDYHNNNADLDVLEEIAGYAFKDLAPHMEDPRVRVIFQDLKEMSGTDQYTDLFLHIVEIRQLSDSNDGPTEITLVVDNYGRFVDLLQEDSNIEVVHSSAS